MTVNDVRKMLPKVGDMRKGGVVVDVNQEHLWYRIEKSVGAQRYFECYRVPDGNYCATSTTKIDPDLAKRSLLVRCINTGKIFAKCSDAGREYGVDKSAVARSARTGCRVGEIYRFEYVTGGVGVV